MGDLRANAFVRGWSLVRGRFWSKSEQDCEMLREEKVCQFAVYPLEDVKTFIISTCGKLEYYIQRI